MYKKRILQTGFSIAILLCLYLEVLQTQKTEKITMQMNEFQANTDVNVEDINFDEVTYDIVSEKIAVNPNYVFTDKEITLYALNDNTPVYSSPEKEEQEIVFSLNKRDSIKSLGYNSYNKTYEVEHIDGNVYYINADNFISDKNMIFDTVEGTKYINTQSANVLDYPSDSSNSLQTLSINNQIQLIAKNDNGYYKIRFNDVEGFINEKYLSDTKINYITDAQKLISNIARNNQGTYPCTSGYCAAWVSGIYQASGLCNPSGNAIDFWLQWKDSGSTSMDNIPVGAVVVGSGSGSALGNQYGHVGVYLGDGLVAENVGYHRIISIQEWAASQVGVL